MRCALLEVHRVNAEVLGQGWLSHLDAGFPVQGWISLVDVEDPVRGCGGRLDAEVPVGQAVRVVLVGEVEGVGYLEGTLRKT